MTERQFVTTKMLKLQNTSISVMSSPSLYRIMAQKLYGNATNHIRWDEIIITGRRQCQELTGRSPGYCVDAAHTVHMPISLNQALKNDPHLIIYSIHKVNLKPLFLIKQEALQLVGPSQTPRCSTWKSPQSVISSDLASNHDLIIRLIASKTRFTHCYAVFSYILQLAQARL